MNPHEEPDFAAMIDRLVDGDLSPEDRRSLLLRLEARPGGWRRCALAFLEAQAWRDALRDPPETAAARPGPGHRSPAEARRRPSLGPLGWLARAAVLAAVFALGWAARPAIEPGPAAPQVAVRPPEMPPLTEAPAPEESPDDPAPSPMPVVARAVTGEGPVSLLSTDLRGRLERRGYQVEERQALAAIELDDGRKVAIPVEEVKFRFVGSRTY